MKSRYISPNHLYHQFNSKIMFDFLLSEKEKNRRLFATNFTIAFELLPKLCKRFCKGNAPIDILCDSNKWKSELKAKLGNNYYGGKLPKIWRDIEKKDGKTYIKIGIGYTPVGMMSEPMCSVIVIDVLNKKYKIFCLERFFGNQYYFSGVDENLHMNYGIQYDSLKIEEFLVTAHKKAFEELEKNNQ